MVTFSDQLRKFKNQFAGMPGKTLVFYEHKDTGKKIKSFLEDAGVPVHFHEALTVDAGIKNFIESNALFCIMPIRTCGIGWSGVGIFRNVAIFDLPAENLKAQGISRVHRIGNENAGIFDYTVEQN